LTPYSVLSIGEVDKTALKSERPYRDYTGGTIELLLDLLRKQSDANPMSVGPPFTVAKLTATQTSIVVGSDICPNR